MNTIYRDLFPIETYFGQFTKFNQAPIPAKPGSIGVRL